MPNVEIVIKTINQGDKETKRAVGSFTELASAIGLARQGLEMLKKGYDFAKEGAQLDFTISKFDRLAVTIGTTGDAMRDKLMTATRGTLSEMDAMAMATDLVSLGLVQTEKDTVRLATVVSGLGMDMNQLVLTLANQTTMRFDQLGVAVTGFDDKVKALKETGMDANQAFTEAFLQQAEGQLRKVGNAADTTLGNFQRFEAQLKDIRDETKMWAAEIAGPLVGAMATNIKEHREFTSVLRELDPELYKQYQWTQTITPAMQKLVYEHENDERIVTAYTARMNALAEAYQRANPETVAAALTVEQVSEQNEMFLGVLGQVDTAMDAYREGLAEANAALASGDIRTKEHAAQVEALAASYEAARQQIVFSIVEMKLATDGWTDAEVDAYLSIGEQLGQFSSDTANAARGALKEADKLVAGFDESTQQMEHVSGRATDAAGGLSTLKDSASAMASSMFDEAIPALQELKSGANSLPPDGTSWTYYVTVVSRGGFPKMPNQGEGLPAGVGYQSGQDAGPGNMGGGGFSNYGTINIFANSPDEFLAMVGSEV
jgi:hypothetical protein